MTLFLFLVWLQMSAQTQIGSTSNTFTCYSRYSGLCQGSPLTADEKAADEVEKQIDALLTELGDRRDLSAADVLYIGETARKRMFNGGEQLLKNLQEIKVRAQRAADETEGKLPPCKMDDGTPCEYKAVVIPPGASMLPVTWPEPVDVPAVQVAGKTTEFRSNLSTPMTECLAYGARLIKLPPDPNWKQHYKCVEPTIHTCADKARILEHDENSPPKYYCRKVQP